MENNTTTSSKAALQELLTLAQITDEALLASITLSGNEPVFPSSYCIGTAAQTSIAAATLAASQIWQLRNNKSQRASVDMRHAAIEFRSERYLRIDGNPPPELWDKIAGCYKTSDDRWLRLHTNFPRHREGILELLQCDYDRDAVTQALLTRQAEKFEQEAADNSLLATMMRSREEWQEHPQGKVVSSQALFTIEKIGEAPPTPFAPAARPLSNIKVLDLTRVIAGPVCGRTLAAHGANVMRLTASHLPSMQPLVIDNGRGKRSAHLDLRSQTSKAQLAELVSQSDVFVQGYRPGTIAARGFSPEQLAQKKPGIVSASLSAYGTQGPWAKRRGFDSLVQMASGINHEEARRSGTTDPKVLPCQALDHAAGYILSFAIMCALHRRMTIGGSWHVSTSLAQAGQWIESLGHLPTIPECPDISQEDATPYLMNIPSGFGTLSVVKHAGILSVTPAHWELPSMPLGSHLPQWTT